MGQAAQMNLVKLSVGTEDIAGLARWQASKRAQGADGLPRHVTRMWPRRADEILAGGSIYWVIRGAIRCRQRILRLDGVTGDDGVRRCAIVLDPEVVATAQATRRPFQGWRYLRPEDAPADLSGSRRGEEALPDALSAALAEIGVL
ncbi:DUF1489 domain-containing protein [Sediminimonas sp.]|uniref:DUF1489 family protein n=1 Tax=Sediminimonas sp. TaxID=2823379 RepID=UPI0025FC81DF|nr:DUF1489 domain-containing protein [Sediminimonas sp.]